MKIFLTRPRFHGEKRKWGGLKHGWTRISGRLVARKWLAPPAGYTQSQVRRMSQSFKQSQPVAPLPRAYSGLVGGISELLEIARRASARTVNALVKEILMP